MQASDPANGSTDVKDTLAFQFLERMLPTAVIASGVAAVVVFVGYREQRVALAATNAVIGIAAAIIWRRFLPRATTADQLDAMTGVIFLGACLSTCFAAQTENYDSPVTVAMLVMLSAFTFMRTRHFLGITTLVVLAPYLARRASGYELGPAHIQLVFLGPIFGAMAGLAFVVLEVQVRTARQALNHQIAELESEKALRIQSEKQFIHAQKMEGLGLLAAGVAHDFNNHLQSIVGYAEVMSFDSSDFKKKEGVRHIRQAALTASEICQRMLAYVGKTQDKSVVVDLVQVVTESQPILAMATRSNQPIRTHFDSDPVLIEGNESAIEQCLLNLVHNSVDSMCGRSGTIDIRIGYSHLEPADTEWRLFGEPLPGDYGVVEVRDDGDGMTPDVLERAFDPYFTTKATGNGFGLATTLGIVCGYGGGIRCQTAIGNGTRIQLLFPRATQAESDSAHPPRNPAPEGRILFADVE